MKVINSCATGNLRTVSAMPHILPSVDTSDISDEEYLVLRAKETDKDPYRSKAWTLTARTLFPQNFDVQFEAYLIEKNNGNVKEAAKVFSELFHSFTAENGLWEEINSLTNALRSDDHNPSNIFLRNMFSFIQPSFQHDILTLTAERSEDTMEHCRLMLLLFKKFPQNTSQLIIRLVDTLMTAEKHGHCSSVINCFRKTLVCEVLPILLNISGDLPTKQLYRFIHKSVEFYLAYLITKPSVVQNCLENENKGDISWESLFSLMKMFGTKLDWELCSIFTPPWNRDTALQHVISFESALSNSPDPVKGFRQFVYCSTVLFAYSLYQYNIVLNPVAESRNSVVLVEAFVAKELDEMAAPPPKRPKVDLSACKTDPIISAGEGAGDVIKHFHFALKCWSSLISMDAYEKEFSKLKQHIKLDSWMADFITDVSLHRGVFDEFQMHIQANTNDIRSNLQKLTFNYITKNYRALGEYSVPIVRQIENLPFLGNYYPSLTEHDVCRHLHYLPVAKIPVLQYVVKLLILMFQKLLQNLTGFDADRVHGYLLILCQMSWPSEKLVALNILKKIRSQRSFTFPLFFKYIINVEILEEFMHMYANEQETIKLDLLGSGHFQSQKRMSTRGADKEVREDIRQMMKQQVCRQEPLYTLIIQFLLEEEKYISSK